MTKEEFVSAVQKRLGIEIAEDAVMELEHGAICGHKIVPVLLCRTPPAHSILGFQDPRNDVVHIFRG